MKIDVALVQQLVETQFPQWSDLAIKPVKLSGWDNRTFRLGSDMTIRLPSAAFYASAVQREQEWLPKLAPHLPFTIPKPLAMGQPDEVYPWHWSIYRWLPGETAKGDNVASLEAFAADLAHFLNALQRIDASDGPQHGTRGGSLDVVKPQAEEALAKLGDSQSINVKAATEIWQTAVQAPIEETNVWYHGDVAAGNLLVQQGNLSSVIDFGGLGVGDPACDVTIAWTFLDAPSRRAFKHALNVSDAVWQRGRGWALWKAMAVVSGLIETNAIEAASSQYAIDQLVGDYLQGE